MYEDALYMHGETLDSPEAFKKHIHEDEEGPFSRMKIANVQILMPSENHAIYSP